MLKSGCLSVKTIQCRMEPACFGNQPDAKKGMVKEEFLKSGFKCLEQCLFGIFRFGFKVLGLEDTLNIHFYQSQKEVEKYQTLQRFWKF